MRGLSWIPVALGAAAVVAGFGSRRKVPAAIVVTAFAGMAAAGAVRGLQRARGNADDPGLAEPGEPEVQRSITIGATADELRRRWLDPETLPRLTTGFATVRALGDGRTHWKVVGPFGRVHEWDSEPVNDGSDAGIGWRSLAGAAIPNEGSVRFRPAPADRGTVVTLQVRFDPPAGAFGDAVVALFGTTPLGLAADAVLHRFKSLVETGEIPTTERQPAARADTR